MINITYLLISLIIADCKLSQPTLYIKEIEPLCSTSSAMYSEGCFPDHIIIPHHLNNFIGKDFAECSEMLYQHHVPQWYWPRGGGIIATGRVKVVNNNNLEVWDSIRIKLEGRKIVAIESEQYKTLLISSAQKANLLEEYEIAKKQRAYERKGPLWWRVDIALINHMYREQRGDSIIWTLEL